MSQLDFNTSNIQATSFHISEFFLTLPNSNPPKQIQSKINMTENYNEDECFDFELEEETVVNIVDHTTNNEYKNIEVLIEEKFTAEELQITEENKEKLSSCLLQEILALTHSITTNVNADESTKKTTNSKLTKPFICEKCGKSYRKLKFYEIQIKYGANTHS